MYGGNRRRAMAGGPGQLRRLSISRSFRRGCASAAGVMFLSLLPSGPARGDDTWFSPPDGSLVFPVLLSAEGKWLNWRDTFGAPRMRLVGGTWKQVGVHQGIDIYTEEDAPVVSMGPGRIERAGWTFYSGWRVGIRGSDGRYYFYAHLSSFAPGLREGLVVSPGDFLGRVGNSGYGTEGTKDEFPPHLHFGLQAGARWVNPESTLRNLYSEALKNADDYRHGLRDSNTALTRLRARAYAPGAPPSAALGPRIQSLLAEADARRQSRLVKLPAAAG